MDFKQHIRVIEDFPKEGISFKDITTIIKFGVPVAYALGIGFIPIRKKGKLPGETYSLTYDLEYGQDTLEIHKDGIRPGMRVAIIDDLLATGGTIAACKDLLEVAGAEVVSIDFVIELTGLKGADKLDGYNVQSMVKYEF